MGIKRVWIEEGCISCNLCEDICPEIFEVPVGGECQTKKGHKKLIGKSAELDEKITEAHMDCPVEVIQIEKD